MHNHNFHCADNLNNLKMRDSTKDTYFEPIIARCKETKNLIWVKKEGITFQMVKNILIRKYERPVLGPCFQLCIPKVVLTDQLIAMHRSIVKAHLGVKRLIMEFMEIFYNPHVHEYARMVIDNCFICAANRHRSKTTRPDFPNKILITVEQPGIFWYSDIIQIVSKKTSPQTKRHKPHFYSYHKLTFLIIITSSSLIPSSLSTVEAPQSS